MVVATGKDHSRILEFARTRYPTWRTTTCPSLLAAIAQASREPARAVLVPLGSDVRRVRKALGGLRLVGGRELRIVLCCEPARESEARELIAAGADDYVVLPLAAEELDAALGVVAEASWRRVAPAPAASMEELARLGEVMSKLEGRPLELLQALAGLLHWALGSRGVTVVAEGAVATSGDPVTRPVLSVPLVGSQGVVGQISVAERAEAGAGYTPGEVEKLAHYGRIAGFVLEAAARQRRLQRLAHTDECSGLPNRRFLLERMEEILKRATTERFPVTVLLFDIDDFKMFNDTCGHDAGDEILRRVGGLFRKHCREQDVVARYGGDEFAVVFWDSEGSRMAGSAPPQQALVVLDRFREALQRESFPRLASGVCAEVTISGGLATYPWDGMTAEELIARADEALLSAKRAGKNRVFEMGRE